VTEFSVCYLGLSVLTDWFFMHLFVDLVWIVCLGSQCSVEVSADEIFVEGSVVPSVILSALQSAQHQQLSTPGSGCDVHGRNVSENRTAPSESARDTVANTDPQRCLRWRGSRKLAETRRHWHPLLLVIPLRLGLSEINPVYFSAIKVNEYL